jgi:SAM-dependent methyltransferase
MPPGWTTQTGVVVDAIFEQPRLAQIYDAVDADRSDLAAYVAVVDELGAQVIVDVGCGTGTFASLLAQQGRDVIGIDPAAASLAVARTKPGADRVQWLQGSASSLPAARNDLVTMTGNVAQVFLSDAEWTSALRAARAALRPGGFFVFEVRDPSRRDWERWTREASYRRFEVADRETVETWVDVTEVRLPFVSFQHSFVFASDGAILTSESTLRFRERAEILDSLGRAGFVVRDVRDAPDRPGLELVFIAQRAAADR